MTTVTVQVPDSVLPSLHLDPAGFVREMRLAAAIKWYELRSVSQENAAGIAVRISLPHYHKHRFPPFS